MFSRRDFLQVSCATVGLLGFGSNLVSAAAKQTVTQDDLLAFEPLGNVTLTHITDIHAQLVPIYFREPSINLGVGAMTGLPPHITGPDFLKKFGIEKSSANAYAMSSEEFTALAKTYGRVGGIDRIATLLKGIRAERSDNTLFFDGGDTWQGSYTSLKTGGEDMVKVMNALSPDAMTAHWEFTFGQERVQELVEQLDFDFLAGNVR
ncbi:MAG: twin-arginine translocation signal domain-containing protein, partial [Sneathiella sp.]